MINPSKLDKLMRDYNRSITPHGKPERANEVISFYTYEERFDNALELFADRFYPSPNIQEDTFVAIAITLDLETAFAFAQFSEMRKPSVIRAIIKYTHHIEYIKLENHKKVLAYLNELED